MEMRAEVEAGGGRGGGVGCGGNGHWAIASSRAIKASKENLEAGAFNIGARMYCHN